MSELCIHINTKRDLLVVVKDSKRFNIASLTQFTPGVKMCLHLRHITIHTCTHIFISKVFSRPFLSKLLLRPFLYKMKSHVFRYILLRSVTIAVTPITHIRVYLHPFSFIFCLFSFTRCKKCLLSNALGLRTGHHLVVW